MDSDLLASFLEYDEITGDFKWIVDRGSLRLKGRVAGCTQSVGSGKKYKVIRIKGKIYYAHRLAWLAHHGVMPNRSIDHINGDSLDNRIVNLRNISRQENQRNMKLSKANTSGVTGVVFDRERKKWAAQIKVGRKNIHLGRFEDKEDAIKARKAAEINHGYHKNHGQKRPL